MTQAEREAAWLRQWQIVRGINISIAAERARGNEEGVRALRPFFDDNYRKLQALTDDTNRGELTVVDRIVLQIANTAEQVAIMPFKGWSLLLGQLVKSPAFWLIAGTAAVLVLGPMLVRGSGRRMDW